MNDFNRTVVFGNEQMDWLKNEITQAAASDMNVVLLLSFSWKSEREFHDKTIHEKIELAELIMALGFNQGKYS